MRVGIVALLHESNTFIPGATTLAEFEADWLFRGDELLKLAASRHEVGGFLEGLERERLTPVPVLAARAIPHGPIARDAADRLLEMLFSQLERAGPLDGLLVAAHGAAVCDSQPDFDGFWLAELRRRVGSSTPIVSTIDLHANLSPRMVGACEATIGYATNPHLDQKERGVEAAALLAATLRGAVRPTQAASFPPLSINIERQSTSVPPCATILAEAGRLRSLPGVLSTSFVLGFPYADVEELGSSAIVVTDGDEARAEELAGSLGRLIWRSRNAFRGELVGVDEALDRVAGRPGPICLLDMGDNVGGGSPGDGTILAHAIDRRALPAAFVCLCDPEVVRQIETARVGERRRLRIGGKTDDLHGSPLEGEFTLVGHHEGRFVETQTRHGGFTEMNQGRTAVLSTDQGLTVMVTSRRVPPFSLVQLTSCGLDPASFQLIVAKGVHAPVAAYEPVCRELVRVNTPGVTCADMVRLEYHHRRRPMFPFETDTEWAGS